MYKNTDQLLTIVAEHELAVSLVANAQRVHESSSTLFGVVGAFHSLHTQTSVFLSSYLLEAASSLGNCCLQRKWRHWLNLKHAASIDNFVQAKPNFILLDIGAQRSCELRIHLSCYNLRQIDAARTAFIQVDPRITNFTL